MGTAVILAIAIVLATFAFHYGVLRWLSGGMARIAMGPGQRILCIVFFIVVAHIGEVILYAAVYTASAGPLGLGSFGGRTVEQPLDFLYFSIVTYTSLGLGDVLPDGHLRFLAGVEALNGLLLIAWSGSFIYLAMGRLWPWAHCVEPAPIHSSNRPEGGDRPTCSGCDSCRSASSPGASAAPLDAHGTPGESVE